MKYLVISLALFFALNNSFYGQKSNKETKESKQKIRLQQSIEKYESKAAEIEKIKEQRDLTEKETIKLNSFYNAANIYKNAYKSKYGPEEQKTNNVIVYMLDGTKIKANNYTKVGDVKTVVDYYDESGKSISKTYKNYEINAIKYPNKIIHFACIKEKICREILSPNEEIDTHGKPVKELKKLTLNDRRLGFHVIFYDKNNILLKYVGIDSYIDPATGSQRGVGQYVSFYLYNREKGFRYIKDVSPKLYMRTLTSDKEINKKLLPIVKEYFGVYTNLIKEVESNVEKEIAFDYNIVNMNLDNSEDLFESLDNKLK